jgi:hypothetical protein
LFNRGITRLNFGRNRVVARLREGSGDDQTRPRRFVVCGSNR